MHAVFPHTAFTKTRSSGAQAKVSIESGSQAHTRHAAPAQEAVSSRGCAIASRQFSVQITSGCLAFPTQPENRSVISKISCVRGRGGALFSQLRNYSRTSTRSFGDGGITKNALTPESPSANSIAGSYTASGRTAATRASACKLWSGHIPGDRGR